MPIDPSILAALTAEYAKAMTRIRGRRVQRLLKREFSGADHVLVAELDSGTAAVLGISPDGAALCATDGKGKHASVFKWSHGSAVALEERFDLLKDSLPILATATLPLDSLRTLQVGPPAIPPRFPDDEARRIRFRFEGGPHFLLETHPVECAAFMDAFIRREEEMR